MNWQNQHIVILGMARQGTALARYLVTHGASVTLSDMKPADALCAEMSSLEDLGASIHFALGGHPMTLLDQCHMLCLSGGVPIDVPIVLEALRRAVPVSNDSQIFFDACPAPILAITGSAGKTTTTTLVGEILRHEFERPHHQAELSGPMTRVWVGGNIGNPLIANLAQIQPGDKVVMELSSFQLEQMTRSPHIACITNVTPNHLDRHGTMEAYINAKRHILDYQTSADWAVLCADDAVSSELTTRAQTAWFSLRHEPRGQGAWCDSRGDLHVHLGITGVDGVVCNTREMMLMGQHNVLNLLAAFLLSALDGASRASMRAIATTFRGVAHRLQLVGEVAGVRYYDDSIATAPERLMAALRTFQRPVVLLCGGRDKHLPWTNAVKLMTTTCRHVILFGEMARLVKAEMDLQQANLSTTLCQTLEQAIHTARQVAQPGDVVLLSPGGTSFDAYKDFEARGDAFVAMVNQLSSKSVD
ncbi:MAG TPA: UDP-N-acetylmuramoyl-L-alanine--D-glutamate ligase [Anaerolineae bacterium]